MDVIDLDFIGDVATHKYVPENNSANHSIIIPEAISVWDEIKDIKEQIADIYDQLDKLKKPLRCKSLL